MLYYAGTVTLNMSEEVFWTTTPRKLSALITVHGEVNDSDDGKGKGKARRKSDPLAYIDQVNLF